MKKIQGSPRKAFMSGLYRSLNYQHIIFEECLARINAFNYILGPIIYPPASQLEITMHEGF